MRLLALFSVCLVLAGCSTPLVRTGSVALCIGVCRISVEDKAGPDTAAGQIGAAAAESLAGLFTHKKD